MMNIMMMSQRRRRNEKKEKKEKEPVPPDVQAKIFCNEGGSHIKAGNYHKALHAYNMALELNPGDKNGLVARSKCYLLLGEPLLALQDAETALHSDKTFIRAIYQKAEALYHLGDFEHSLMYYHRGHRLRPELEIFRLGVQKAQEAIENTIGNAAGLNGPKKVTSTPRHSITTTKLNESSRSEKSSALAERRVSCGVNLGLDTKRSSSSGQPSENPERYSRRRSKSAAPNARRGSRNLLGELGADRIYLENLLKHPDILCSNQEATSVIIAQAEEGIAFLKSRQEFWRQQRPNSTPTVKKIKAPTSNLDTSSQAYADPA